MCVVLGWRCVCCSWEALCVLLLGGVVCVVLWRRGVC